MWEDFAVLSENKSCNVILLAALFVRIGNGTFKKIYKKCFSHVFLYNQASNSLPMGEHM